MKTFTILTIPHLAVLTLPIEGWALMLTYVFMMFIALKAATLLEVESHDFKRDLLYATTWIGMNTEEFNGKTNKKPLFENGIFSLSFGVLLIIPTFYLPNGTVKAAIFFAALIFIFHFGVLDLNAQLWRKFKRNTRPIMKAPWNATSLSDFWGRRWNMAFRDAAHKLIFKPLARKYGPRQGVLAVFLFSGLVHEAVISVPADAGYGGPMLYFMIQYYGIMAQRTFHELNTKFFTWHILLVPLPLLFHKAFFTNVFIPLTNIIGG